MAEPKTGAYPDLAVGRGGNTLSCTTVTIGAASSLLLAANPKRVLVKIKNTHATQLLDVDGVNPAVAAVGWAVAPVSAEVVTIESTAAIYAISNGAGTLVELMEISQA